MSAAKFMLLCIALNISVIYAQSNLPYNPYRLRKTVLPLEYKINLTPRINDRTFDGTVDIKFKVDNASIDRISMHANLLGNIAVDRAASTIDVDDPTFDTRYDFMDFLIRTNLVEGTEYTLRLTYNGVIQSAMDGFYSSSYEENNVKKNIGTTMSFPTNARSIVPCFDEPGFKALFELSINCPNTFTCIANMKQQSNTGGLVRFYPTPLMSSYLIAFIVSDFVAAEEVNEPKQFRIWARPGAKDMGKYAFDIGQELLENMGQYTDIDYYSMDTNMKMDHVAIPDFPAGAMENWGLVTYREDNLLFHPDHSPVKSKQRVASVVAHETAHMWFGDLATYDWFYCPWMSEAFGRYFEFFLTETAEEFGMEEQFIVAQVHTALQADSTINANPMTYPTIHSTAEILAHFGTISYNKGASILRMVEHWIGEENFKNGLRAYLTQKQFKTATPDDLFDALDSNTNVNVYNTTVKGLMTVWTTTSGYPLLTVSVDSGTGRIITRQERYTIDAIAGNYYPIPITYTTESTIDFKNTTPAFIQSGYENSMPRPGQGWIIFNLQQTGFYKVRYRNELLDLLIEALNGASRDKIHKYNRAQLIDDAFTMARDNYIAIGSMMDTIQFLEHETDFAPWSAAYVAFNFLRLHFGRIAALSEDFDTHLTNLMTKVVDHVGSVKQDDPNLLRLLYTNTMVFACALGNENCIRNSTDSFEKLKLQSIEVVPDSREHVYCNGLRHGDGDDFDFLWRRYLEHNVPSEKSIILGALGCTKVDTKLNEYLMHTLEEDSKIRVQDRMQAFNSALMGNPENVEKTYLFIVDNIKKIREVYGSGLISMMISLSGRMSENELGRLEAFVDSTSDLSTNEKNSVRNSINENRRIVIRMASKSAEVIQWIDNKYNSAGSISASIFLIITSIIAFLTQNY